MAAKVVDRGALVTESYQDSVSNNLPVEKHATE